MTLQRCGDMGISITWLKFSTACKKLWAWTKKNWKLLVGMVIPIVLTVVFRKKIDLSKILTRIKDDHQRELDLIEIAREKELRKIRLADKEYRETVQEIEAQYEKQLQALDVAEREKIREILYESGDDADQLTEMLAEKFKFRVIDGGRQ